MTELKEMDIHRFDATWDLISWVKVLLLTLNELKLLKPIILSYLKYNSIAM